MEEETGPTTKVEKVTRQIVNLFHKQELEEKELRKRRERLAEEIDRKRKEITELEREKASLDAEVTTLKLRDKMYQKEHSNLRNSITTIKFQIEKIKESIELRKQRELEDLKEFERAVDDITDKFRSSPAIYDRQSLAQKQQEEQEKRKLLLERVEGTREAYANFNREMGLRERRHEDEELLNCVLPGSELYARMEMTKALDEVVRDMKKQTNRMKEMEKELEELDDAAVKGGGDGEGSHAEATTTEEDV